MSDRGERRRDRGRPGALPRAAASAARRGLRRLGDRRRRRRDAARRRTTPTGWRRRARRSTFVCERLLPALRRTDEEIIHILDGARRAVRAARPERRADARHGPRPADRPQLLLRRSALDPQHDRLDGRDATWRAAWSSGTCARRAPIPESVGISIWGTARDAHLRRRHRPGAGAARRAAGLAAREPARGRRRGRSRSKSWAARASTSSAASPASSATPSRTPSRCSTTRSSASRAWTSRSTRTSCARTALADARPAARRGRRRGRGLAAGRLPHLRQQARHLRRRHPAADRRAGLARRRRPRGDLRQLGRLRLHRARSTASTRAARSARRSRRCTVAIKNQDNREHDIFDSDDYFQFHGGMIATHPRADRAEPARLLRRHPGPRPARRCAT